MQDGSIVAAAQEERFTRKKGDPSLPEHAIDYCLSAGNVEKGDLDLVVFYEKPITKFTRLLATYTQVAPSGLKSFLSAVPAWLREKAWVALKIEKLLQAKGYGLPRDFQFTEHHQAHAASAFFPSPYDDAAILTVDGVGEWTTTAVGVGERNRIQLLYEQQFPHSLGLLYSAFTYFTGFRVNSGEYKLMGLAPYGSPVYADRIRDQLISIREDGSFRLNLKYFGFLDGFRMTNRHFASLFDGPARQPESQITQREMDLARSIQVVTEEIILKMARYARATTGKPNLCIAGGVGLNCVANGKIVQSGIFDNLWIQPAAGDSGGALGAATFAWYQTLGNPRDSDGIQDKMSGAFLGPRFDDRQTRSYLDQNQYAYHELNESDLIDQVASAVASEKVVGLFQGRMEFGPRALGNRSIIADARSEKMQSHLNLATKFRESFRPFAPIVLREDAHEYFQTIHDSPYMLLVDQLREDRLVATNGNGTTANRSLKEWVNQKRSDVPAITHVDHSARIQTVDSGRHPRLHRVLSRFKELTGESIMVNTSFNVRSEPIVCTPEDAYVCFMRTGMDVLVLDNLLLHKNEQPNWVEQTDWRESFEID